MNRCCLCGSPYEGIGNNPQPLVETGRCCDACNEVVVRARINALVIEEEIERVGEALTWALGDPRKMALAAICVTRGPAFLALKQRIATLGARGQ